MCEASLLSGRSENPEQRKAVRRADGARPRISCVGGGAPLRRVPQELPLIIRAYSITPRTPTGLRWSTSRRLGPATDLGSNGKARTRLHRCGLSDRLLHARRTVTQKTRGPQAFGDRLPGRPRQRRCHAHLRAETRTRRSGASRAWFGTSDRPQGRRRITIALK